MAALSKALVDRYHQALEQIINGNPDVYKELLSEHEDVTLGNPFGPFARGHATIERRLEGAAGNYTDGEITRFEEIARCETPEMAYLVEVEHFKAKVGGSNEMAPIALRVTTIFRPEGGSWKWVHRHADPITTEQPADSVLQR